MPAPPFHSLRLFARAALASVIAGSTAFTLGCPESIPPYALVDASSDVEESGAPSDVTLDAVEDADAVGATDSGEAGGEGDGGVAGDTADGD